MEILDAADLLGQIKQETEGLDEMVRRVGKLSPSDPFRAGFEYQSVMVTAAGLAAGALTQSSVIGTASGALSQLDLPEKALNTQLANIAAAYAVTYVLGYILTSGPENLRNLEEADRWYVKSAAAGCPAGALGHGLRERQK